MTNESANQSLANDTSNKPKPLICCTHGQECKKGRRERVDNFSLLNFYIGAVDRRQARRLCRKRGTFRLFHEFKHNGQLDNLEPELKLLIVYRNDAGVHNFFPIVE